jgi:hypothetical protein
MFRHCFQNDLLRSVSTCFDPQDGAFLREKQQLKIPKRYLRDSTEMKVAMRFKIRKMDECWRLEG